MSNGCLNPLTFYLSIQMYSMMVMTTKCIKNEFFLLSVLKVKAVSVLWSTLLPKIKNNNTQMPHSMKPSLPQSSQPHFSISYFFSLPEQTAGGLATFGMLPGLSCFKWNSLASTPPPPLATMSQTLTSLMEEGGKKKHSVQRWLAAIKCKKKKWGSCRAGADLLTQGFGLRALMLHVLLQDGPCLLEKWLSSGLDWRKKKMVVNNYRKWQDGCGN